MRNLTKKIMVYSMVGMMQLGLGATVGSTVIEASPLHNDSPQRIVQLDSRQQQIIENQRHEREIRQRPNEDEQGWRARQNIENIRHDRATREIDAD
jgi:hypothetical protein